MRLLLKIKSSGDGFLSKKTKQEIMSLFETGDKPNGDDYATLIEAIFDNKVPGEVGEIDYEMIKAPDYDKSTTVIEDVETNIPYSLIQGFRGSDNGSLTTNAPLWRTTSDVILNSEETIYKIKHPATSNPPQFRVIRYNNQTQFVGASLHSVNEEFTLPENIGGFFVNFSLPGATPNSNPPITPFSDITSMQSLRIVKITRNITVTPGEESSVRDALLSIEKRLAIKDKPIKILMLGNSFSEDVCQYIHEIANSADVDAIIGNLYRGGETFEGHWTEINTNANSYTYHLRTALNGETAYTVTNNVSFLTTLKSQDWDIITYQQGSPLSGMYDTFKPYLANIIGYVNANKTNQKLKHALHMTWAYPTNSTEPGFANYNNNQQTMYTAIVNAYQQAMFDNDIDLVIPVGTAIQNARTIPYLQSLHNDLASDGYHLGPAGDLIGGLTIFEALIAAKCKKDIFEDVKYTLANSKYHAYLGKLAVKNAVLNPFNVTDI